MLQCGSTGLVIIGFTRRAQQGSVIMGQEMLSHASFSSLFLDNGQSGQSPMLLVDPFNLISTDPNIKESIS